MLFRTTNGDLITIRRTNYVSDAEYYRYIMKTIDPDNTGQDKAAHTVAHFSSLRAIAKVVPLEPQVQHSDTS